MMIALGANLYKADLSGRTLRGANFYGADLSNSNLSNSDLRGANFRIASLRNANLRGSNLSGADFWEADLYGADLTFAILDETCLIDGGERSDGYRHIGQVRDGVLWILAGCHYMPIHQARHHWQKYRDGQGKSAESLAICDQIERMAESRGWTSCAAK